MKYSLLLLLALTGCVTNNSENEPPPEITSKMSLDDLLKAGIQHGGATLVKVKNTIQKLKRWPDANRVLEPALIEGIVKYNNPQLVNTANLFQSSTSYLPLNVFNKLVTSGRPLARELGWQLAANMPSQGIAKAIEDHITNSINDGEEQDLLVPAAAMAVQANQLTSAYTLMRQGLMTNGDEAFAKAMSILDPHRSSDDFLNYLALAPIEELRQMSQHSVNMYTCMLILRHLSAFPASPSHPRYEHIFMYAISRNNGLAELGNLALAKQFERSRRDLAVILARMPSWIQIAFIENVRRTSTSESTQFLAELKQISSQNEVLEELGVVQR